jgi:hypothetical protein
MKQELYLFDRDVFIGVIISRSRPLFVAVCLRQLACWDCGFEFLRGQGCVSLVNVVLLGTFLCDVPIPLSEESYVVCESDLETSTLRRPRPMRVAEPLKKADVLVVKIV